MGSIQIEQVSFKYHKASQLFDHFNQDIPLQKPTQITGSNGVGKTTLLKLIANLLEPQSGHVRIPKGLTIRLALSESPGLFPRLTGAENLKIFSKLLKFKLEGLSEWEENIAFKKALVTPVKDASEGMKKSLVLYRAFLSGDIVLLDEPFLSLDENFCTWLNQKIVHSKKTVIITSHRKLDFIEEPICLS